MKVFISHSTEDKDFAHKLSIALKRHGVSVFDASKEIAPGDSITDVVSESIKASEAIVFVISEAFSKSRWANAELLMAINNLASGQKKLIIPVKLDKTTKPPFFLQDFLYLDMSSIEFDEGVKQLIDALDSKRPPSDYTKTIENEKNYLLAQKKLLELEKAAYEQLQKKNSSQLTSFVLVFVSIFAAASIAIIVLKTTGKNIADLSVVGSAVSGLLAAVVGYILGYRREAEERSELAKKIHELEINAKQREFR